MKLEELQDLMRSVFQNNSLAINENTTIDSVAEWDSLSHLNLVLELEQVTGSRFTTEQIQTFTSVQAILDHIKK